LYYEGNVKHFFDKFTGDNFVGESGGLFEDPLAISDLPMDQSDPFRTDPFRTPFRTDPFRTDPFRAGKFLTIKFRKITLI